MKKYILFCAEVSAPGWEQRTLAKTGALTDILTEQLDCSDAPLPQVGDRPLEFVQVSQFHDPQRHGRSTHYREGDWEVVRVHTYTPDIPVPHGGDYDMIVICTCQYVPIDSPLQPMPERQVSLDSFGGDVEAYERWQAGQFDGSASPEERLVSTEIGTPT